MAGTVDMVMRAFAGLQIRGDTLAFTPGLPHELHQLGFRVHYRGQCIDVTLDHQRLRLAAHPCTTTAPIRIDLAGTPITLAGGQTHEITLNPRDHSSHDASTSPLSSRTPIPEPPPEAER